MTFSHVLPHSPLFFPNSLLAYREDLNAHHCLRDHNLALMSKATLATLVFASSVRFAPLEVKFLNLRLSHKKCVAMETAGKSKVQREHKESITSFLK